MRGYHEVRAVVHGTMEMDAERPELSAPRRPEEEKDDSQFPLFPKIPAGSSCRFPLRHCLIQLFQPTAEGTPDLSHQGTVSE